MGNKTNNIIEVLNLFNKKADEIKKTKIKLNLRFEGLL